jgi:peptidoglycan/LPS O-acetylase OafA/YrhL
MRKRRPVATFGYPRYSIQDRLNATNNRPSGFDYLRIVLAVCVVLWHVPWLISGTVDGPIMHWVNPVAFMVVPLFFALSGFLVAGSLDRSKTMVMFLGLRALRIGPALMVEILLSALILGPLLTTLTLRDYFSGEEFRLYFLNLVGYIHYYLPGVFKANKHTYVNGQLWTVPYELVIYFVLSCLAALGIYRRKSFLLVIVGLYYAAQVVNTILHGTVFVTGFPTGAGVTMAAISGLAIYRHRDQIPFSKGLFWFSVALTLVLVAVQGGTRFVALPVAYVAVYLGLLDPPRNKILLSGDYSYGVYLYGFPIQQALIAISPIFSIWYWHAPTALFCSFAVATCSWWLIEKPALGQRDWLKAIEKRWLALRDRITARLRSRFDDSKLKQWLLRVTPPAFRRLATVETMHLHPDGNAEITEPELLRAPAGSRTA